MTMATDETIEPIPLPLPLGEFLDAGGDPREVCDFSDEVEWILTTPDADMRRHRAGIDRWCAEQYRNRREFIPQADGGMRETRTDEEYAGLVAQNSWGADLYEDPDAIIPKLLPFLDANAAAMVRDPLKVASYHLELSANALEEDILPGAVECLDDMRVHAKVLMEAKPDFEGATLEEEAAWYAEYPGYRLAHDKAFDLLEILRARVERSATFGD